MIIAISIYTIILCSLLLSYVAYVYGHIVNNMHMVMHIMHVIMVLCILLCSYYAHSPYHYNLLRQIIMIILFYDYDHIMPIRPIKMFRLCP